MGLFSLEMLHLCPPLLGHQQFWGLTYDLLIALRSLNTGLIQGKGRGKEDKCQGLEVGGGITFSKMKVWFIIRNTNVFGPLVTMETTSALKWF